MVNADRGKPNRESLGVTLKNGLTHSLLGDAMATTATAPKPKRKKSKTSPTPTYSASMIVTAGKNLINMDAVTAVSGAVLLVLLAAKHFSDSRFCDGCSYAQ
jgi:hypothetical protein